MRRFQFRLQRLLELRRYREREWELKLAKITGVCLMHQKRIDEIRSELTRSTMEKSAFQEKPDYNYLISIELYNNRLKLELEDRYKVLEEENKKLKEIQKEYLEHSKRRKVLEKLKERQEREYYRLQRLEDIKAADDINSSRFIRNNINTLHGGKNV